jgi:hypothetical protein
MPVALGRLDHECKQVVTGDGPARRWTGNGHKRKLSDPLGGSPCSENETGSQATAYPRTFSVSNLTFTDP